MGFPLATNADTSMNWTGMKRKFRVEGDGVVCATWDYDEGWTEIYSEREWKEMMQRAFEIPAPKNNGGFSRRLVVSVPRKKGIVSRFKT